MFKLLHPLFWGVILLLIHDLLTAFDIVILVSGYIHSFTWGVYTHAQAQRLKYILVI